MLISYHNDPELKAMIVEEMENHRKQDQIIKGTYGKENGVFKGCAVGCAIHSMNARLGKSYRTDDHSVFEEAIGVPEWLAQLSDTLFEGLPDKDNADFAVDFLKAIPVGVNLEPVKWKFCAYLMKENIDRVLSLKIKDDLKEQVVGAIRQCLAVHEDAIKTGVWDKAAANAASAAWAAANAARAAANAASAAWAAASAAWAAESAAWAAANAANAAERAAAWAASAAWAAAWVAERPAFTRYSKELLRLLRKEK